MKLFLLILPLATSKVYFQETFPTKEIPSSFVHSKKNSDLGQFKITAGKWFGDSQESLGLQTSQDARFYAISTLFKEPFSNAKVPLVIQFTVKHEQSIDCGGGYIKLFSSKVKPKDFDGNTDYYVMFGPDICGPTKKVHVILKHEDKHYLIKQEITAESDVFTHLYTLIIEPNKTYKVLIDGKEVKSGKLSEDWDMLPPKTIPDPKAKKPADWVDEAEIADPTDEKPEGWDDIPEFIADPDAVKPEDWDDDLDGEWEAPNINNPDYVGPWVPKMIPNPEYKGPWVHPHIDNPDYKDNVELGVFSDIGGFGLDLWQVKSGTIFDNFLIGDNVKEAKEFAKKHVEPVQKKEKDAKEAFDEKNKPEEKTETPDLGNLKFDIPEANEEEEEDDDDDIGREEL